jgi:hypothetical protein
MWIWAVPCWKVYMNSFEMVCCNENTRIYPSKLKQDLFCSFSTGA